jgi:hypothetical protein
MRSRRHAVTCSRQYEVVVCCVSSEIRTVLYFKTVCPCGLFKMDTEKLIGLVRNNIFLCDDVSEHCIYSIFIGEWIST